MMVAFIAVILIAFGVLFNLARVYPTVRHWVEVVLFGGDPVITKEHEYAKSVRWLGWPSIALGFGVLIPSPMYLDLIIAGVVIIIFYNARRQYQKFQEENKAALTREAQNA